MDVLVIQELSKADQPLSELVLFKQLRSIATDKPSEEDYERTLRSLISETQIFRFPPSRKGGKPRLWTYPPIEVLARKLRTVLKESDNAMTITALRRKIAKWEVESFDEALGHLINKNQAWYLYRQGKQYVLGRSPLPCDFLSPPQIRSLRMVTEQVNKHRSAPLTWDVLQDFLNGMAEATAPQASANLLNVDSLKAWYEQDRGNRFSAMIPIMATWRRYQAAAKEQHGEPDRSAFLRFMQSLFDDSQISLEGHERPGDLTPEERSLTLKMAYGHPAHFWSWRNS